MVCRSQGRLVSTMEEESEESEEEVAFMGMLEGGINAVDSTGELWQVKVLLNDTGVTFKIDTGADVTAIPPRVFKKLTKVRLMRTAGS